MRLARKLMYVPLPVAQNRRAAVLAPLEPDLGVWLTKRNADLTNHAGQVAFPGGMVDPADDSVAAAALREAEEEIGLRREQTDVLGQLDDFVTGTGFHISPVVALVPKGGRFLPAAAEVQEIFCLPFAMLLDPQGPRARKAVVGGRMRAFWVWPHDEHVIWGATAAILLDLARRLRG